MLRKIVLLVGVVIFFGASLTTQADTGSATTGTVTTGATTSSTTTTLVSTVSSVVTNLYQNLTLQKQNIDALLIQQDSKLLTIKMETIQAGTSGDYDIVLCLGMSGLDRSIPTDTLRKASADDYIALSNKVQALDIKQKNGQTGLEMDIDALNIQIANYSDTYQKMILQIAQKTLDRFTANQTAIQTYITQHTNEIQAIKINKQRIEQTVTTFDTLQQNLRGSRLMYGLTMQEFAASRAGMKQRFLTSYGAILDKDIAKLAKQYRKYVGFTGAIQTEKDLGMLLFGAKYDMRWDTTIGKYVDDRSLSVLDSLVGTIRATYFASGAAKCEIMKTIGSKEGAILDEIQAQLTTFSKDLSIDMTGATSTSGQLTLRKQFASLLESFYNTTTKEDLASFRKTIKEVKKDFAANVQKDLVELDAINTLNEQFWSVEKTGDQQKIADELLPRCKYLVKKTIHLRVKERCEKIISSTTKRLGGTTTPVAAEKPTTDKPSTTTTNSTVTTGATTSSPSTPPTSSSTSTTTTPESSSLAAADIAKKVQDQLTKLTTKYPDPKTRRAAIMVVINSVKTKLSTGGLSADDTALYTALKAALEKEAEKLKSGQ